MEIARGYPERFVEKRWVDWSSHPVHKETFLAELHKYTIRREKPNKNKNKVNNLKD